MWKREVSEQESRFLTGSLIDNKSMRYERAEAMRQQNTSRRILNQERDSTGSQWRLFRIGVTWSHFLVHTTRQAAQFWSFWASTVVSLVDHAGSLDSWFPMSSLLVTKTCTICSVAPGVRYMYLFILAMLRRWKIAARETEVIYSSMVMWLSKCTPRLQTLEDEMTANIQILNLDLPQLLGRSKSNHTNLLMKVLWRSG